MWVIAKKILFLSVFVVFRNVIRLPKMVLSILFSNTYNTSKRLEFGNNV